MNGGRVLIADNELSHAKVIGLNLERAGYEVAVVADGATAIRRAKEWQPNVLILDLVMPNLDGYDVVGKLKAAVDTRDIPILMLTGLRRDLVEQMPRSHEPDHFMTKPFDLDQLERAVARMASQRTATRN